MDKFILEHGFLWYVIATGMLALVVWLIKRLLDSMLANWKENISNVSKEITGVCASVVDLYNKYNDHEHRLTGIEVEHRIMSGIHVTKEKK